MTDSREEIGPRTPATGEAEGEKTAPATAEGEAPVLENRDRTAEGSYRRAIFSVPVDVVVAVGSAQPVIGELLAMRRDTVLPLSSRVDDPVQIMVGDRVIARGELEELGEDGGRLGVRLTEVVDVSDLF